MLDALTFCRYFLKQRIASFKNIVIRHIEAARIPRVGSVSAAGGVIHQLMHFTVRVTLENAQHIADVGAVHADEQVIFIIVALLQLHRPFAVTGKPMLF